MHNLAPEQEGMFEAEGGWIGPYVLLVLTVLFIVVICYVYCKCRKCLKGDDSGQLPGDDGFKATPAMGGGGGGGGGELQMQPMCAHTRSPCTVAPSPYGPALSLRTGGRLLLPRLLTSQTGTEAESEQYIVVVTLRCFPSRRVGNADVSPNAVNRHADVFHNVRAACARAWHSADQIRSGPCTHESWRANAPGAATGLVFVALPLVPLFMLGDSWILSSPSAVNESSP